MTSRRHRKRWVPLSRMNIRHRSFNMPPSSIPAGGILPCARRQIISNSDSGHEQGTLDGHDITEVRAATEQKPAEQNRAEFRAQKRPSLGPRYVFPSASISKGRVCYTGFMAVCTPAPITTPD